MTDRREGGRREGKKNRGGKKGEKRRLLGAEHW